MFMQNPWQCLVWWVVGVFNGGTVCRRRLLQQGYIRDMVHTNLARIHIHRDRAQCLPRDKIVKIFVNMYPRALEYSIVKGQILLNCSFLIIRYIFFLSTF